MRWRNGKEAFIDIVDHGLGISREDQSRFSIVLPREIRGDRSHRGNQSRPTLALHIVERTKAGAGYSEVGHGSTFSVRIPMQEPI
jgi:signal transduction histidine kinase